MHLEVVADDRWSAVVAARWAERLAAQPGLRQCLPTGTTPVPVYRDVAASVARGETSFARAEVFLLDELGGLPRGHPARCDTMLRRGLLDDVDLPSGRFHRLDPDAPDLADECRRFQAEVDHGGLDLVLLGLGTNGHVGLNEPGSDRTAPTRRVTLAEETRAGTGRYGVTGTPPTWGLTLGLAPILAAGEIWLLVSGTVKAGILERTLTDPIGPQLPASFLREHPALRVMADRSAAAGL